MEIRVFEKEDLYRVELQDEQRHEFENQAFNIGNSFTAVAGGEVIGVFGFFEIHRTRAIVFSFISRKASKYMLPLVRKMRQIIDEGLQKTALERIEMEVLEEFAHGERFAKMLGFE